MKWILVLLVIALVVIVLRMKTSSALSPDEAREQLKDGGLLVDVRTAAEYGDGHLAHAVNVPLDQIEQTLPCRVPNKDRALLLHCRSGRRSGIAEQQLRALGYTNVYNLGGYARAKKIFQSVTERTAKP